MIIETKEIYKCEFCKKLYQKKNAAANHEETCKKNPENFRACFGCVFLEKKPRQYFYDTFNGEDSRMLDVLHCNSKDILVHPPKVEHKGNAYDFGDIMNEPMPRECDKRKFYLDQFA